MGILFSDLDVRKDKRNLKPGPGGLNGLRISITLSGTFTQAEFRKIWPSEYEWFWPLVAGLLDFLKLQLGIIAGMALAGATVLGLLGTLGLGAGAVPGAVTGAWLGGMAGVWIAKYYGLFLALEYIVENFAEATPHLQKFFHHAWNARGAGDHRFAAVELARATAILGKLFIEGLVIGVLFRGGILAARGTTTGGRYVFQVLKREQEAVATINGIFEQLSKAKIATFSAGLLGLLRQRLVTWARNTLNEQKMPDKKAQYHLKVPKRYSPRSRPLPRGARRGEIRLGGDSAAKAAQAAANVAKQTASALILGAEKKVMAPVEIGKGPGPTEEAVGAGTAPAPRMRGDRLDLSEVNTKKQIQIKGETYTVTSGPQAVAHPTKDGKKASKCTIQLGEGIFKDLLYEEDGQVINESKPHGQDEKPAWEDPKTQPGEGAPTGGGGHGEGSTEWLYGLGSDALAAQIRHAVDQCDSVSAAGKFEGTKVFTFLFTRSYGVKEILYTIRLNDRGQLISAKAVATDVNGKAHAMGLVIASLFVEKTHPRALKPSHTLMSREELIDLIKKRRNLDFTNKEDYAQLQLPTQ